MLLVLYYKCYLITRIVKTYHLEGNIEGTDNERVTGNYFVN